MKERRQQQMEDNGKAEEACSHRDRLGDLPDALKHEILSHLEDMRQVVHTSILSNKWRHIWSTTPFLNFNLDIWLNDCSLESLDDEKDAFIRFVNNFLTRTTNNIFRFRLVTYNHDFDDELPLLSSWIRQCVERNVKQLTILTPLAAPVPDEEDESQTLDFTSFFPCNLFDSDIKEAILSFCPEPLVTLPSINHSSMLTSLRLHGVRLPEGNGNGELVLTCNVLQDLKMTICDVDHLKSILVFIPLVRMLWFRLYKKREAGCNRVKVKIHAPLLGTFNLTTFSDKRQAPLYYSIADDLLELVCAYVYVYTDKQYDLLDQCSQFVVKILSRLYNARDLHLVISTKQVLLPVLWDGHIQNQFQNLRCLTLVDRVPVPCIQEILNFLLRCPRVDTLVWERPVETFGSIPATEEARQEETLVADGQKKLVLNLPLESLKTVETRNFKGLEIELQFLAILLKRATALEQLIIRYNYLSSSGKLTRFHEKISSLPRASSNVSLSFEED